MKKEQNIGGGKTPTHAGEPAIDDLGNSSNGTPLNASATSDGEWYIQVPDDIVDGIRAQFGADREVGLNKAAGFMKMGYLMAQSFGSLVTTDQLKQVIDEGAERMGKQGEAMRKELVELSTSLKVDLAEAQSNGNSELAEIIGNTEKMLNTALEAINNPKNTDSVPYVVANFVQPMVAEALAFAQKAQEAANDEQMESLERKLRGLEAHHAKLVQSIESEREALREAFGLQSKLNESKDKSHSKGVEFEDAISARLAMITGIYGDESQDIGDKTDGIGLSKVGDHLVTVKSGGNTKGNIVFEDKSGAFSLGGKSSIVSQLKTAMTNYGATAAIGVVNASKAPAGVRKAGYLRLQSNIHLVCVDWDNDDYSGLDILYPIVRELAIVDHDSDTGETSGEDHEAIINICNECLTRLKDFNKMKRNLRDGAAKTILNVADEIEIVQHQWNDSFKQIIRLLRGGSSE
jgi:hypothetical protein